LDRGTIEERLARLESQSAADRQALRNLQLTLTGAAQAGAPDFSRVQEKLDGFKATLLELQSLFVREVEQLTNEFQSELFAELSSVSTPPSTPEGQSEQSARVPDEEELNRFRLDGVRLGAREMSHLINNDITLAFGVFELLLGVQDLGEQKLRLIRESQAGLYRAAARLRQFQQVQRIVTHDTPSGRALDLNASQ
jgi:hypothetical protein